MSSSLYWFKDQSPTWEFEFEKLTKQDFESLEIDKEKLFNVLSKLYGWRVIR